MKKNMFNLGETVELLSMINSNIECYLTDEKKGILPHDIPNASYIFIDKKASYSKGDYIVIIDKRYGEKGRRITKALSDNEEDFYGKLVLSIKRFNNGE